MSLLDTNGVSETMKPDPHPSVRDWLDARAAETLFLSSVTVAELLFGIDALPRGKRKDRLTSALDGVFDLFATRILAFDTTAARRYAELAVKARSVRKGFPTPYGYIAAIAAAHGCAVASRDTSAINAAGLTVIMLDRDQLIGFSSGRVIVTAQTAGNCGCGKNFGTNL
ncbi:MAG: type II toxin-antitoxin system VapC family toxin [Bradyrhizobiaceae bacterium]|nr:MAG: type II toxin-antitoxin system VapC family toxin [Bradyrhizobiaceae bacterium]